MDSWEWVVNSWSGLLIVHSWELGVGTGLLVVY